MAIFVCIQHTLTDCDTLLGIILLISRIAVPVFLLISGYYFTPDWNKIKSQIFKLFRITCCMTAIYFVFDVLKASIIGTLEGYFANTFTVNNFIKLCLFNDPFIADHAWYIFACIYSLPVVYGIIRINNGFLNNAVIVSTLLFLLLFGKYSTLLFLDGMPNYITRSWIGVGVPFLLIGYVFKNKLKSMSVKKTLIFIICSLILNLEEYFYFKNMNMGGARSICQYYFLGYFCFCAFFEFTK